MPNHVENRVECSNIEALWMLRDFDLIVPMPLSLNVTSGGISRTFEKLFKEGKSLDEITKILIGDKSEGCAISAKEIRRYWINMKLFGESCWYEWRWDNWGTKWSAYEYELMDEACYCRFNTAWAHCYPVIEALSKMFPEDVFEVWFAEEFIGTNAGHYVIQNGIYLDNDFMEDNSLDAYETAFFLWGGEDYYQYDPILGTYVYKDEDEDEDEEVCEST